MGILADLEEPLLAAEGTQAAQALRSPAASAAWQAPEILYECAGEVLLASQWRRAAAGLPPHHQRPLSQLPVAALEALL